MNVEGVTSSLMGYVFYGCLAMNPFQGRVVVNVEGELSQPDLLQPYQTFTDKTSNPRVGSPNPSGRTNKIKYLTRFGLGAFLFWPHIDGDDRKGVYRNW